MLYEKNSLLITTGSRSPNILISDPISNKLKSYGNHQLIFVSTDNQRSQIHITLLFTTYFSC